MPAPAPTDIATLTYEQARDELLVALAESMTLWQRGEELADHCSTWLDRAEASLTEGTPASSAADPT